MRLKKYFKTMALKLENIYAIKCIQEFLEVVQLFDQLNYQLNELACK